MWIKWWQNGGSLVPSGNCFNCAFQRGGRYNSWPSESNRQTWESLRQRENAWFIMCLAACRSGIIIADFVLNMWSEIKSDFNEYSVVQLILFWWRILLYDEQSCAICDLIFVKIVSDKIRILVISATFWRDGCNNQGKGKLRLRWRSPLN